MTAGLKKDHIKRIVKSLKNNLTKLYSSIQYDLAIHGC